MVLKHDICSQSEIRMYCNSNIAYWSTLPLLWQMRGGQIRAQPNLQHSSLFIMKSEKGNQVVYSSTGTR